MSTSNKADPEWDSHKATIESLYVRDNLRLEGSGGLMDTMARSHGFAKTKAQYEGYFKKWGMRKYRKKDDWKSIGWKVAKRKRAGKDSDVYMNNEVIPKAKVQKQIRRHDFTTAFERSALAPSPRTSDGFEIRTPVAEDMAPFSQLQNVTPYLPLLTRTNAFPFAQLQNASPSLPPSMGTDDLLLPQLQNSTSPFPPWMGTDDFPFSPIEDVTHLFQRCAYNLPFFQLEAGLYGQVNLPLITTNAQRHGFEVSLRTRLLLEDHQYVSHEVVGVHDAVLEDPEALSAVFKALLPSAAHVSQAEEHLVSRPNNHRSDCTFPRLLTLLLFAVANNFAGLHSLPTKEIMQYLKRQTNTRLLQHVLSTSGPESEAFAENLFRIAIESEDAQTLEVLLQKGLNPNDLVCNIDGRNYTPVECSSRLHNIEITRLLLRAKANPNKTLEVKYALNGALQLAIGTGLEHIKSLELVRMLLEAGGEVSADTFEHAIMTYDEDLVDLLVDFGAKTKHLDWLRSDIPETVTAELDNEFATRIVISIFRAGVGSAHDVSTRYLEYFCRTLDIAAWCGNLDLVHFLLRSGVRLNDVTLNHAIRSKNKDLIRLLLDDGADVESLDCYGATPLAEAIRWGDVEILNLLKHRDAWSQIGQFSQFKAALLAASEVGQLTIVQKLLSLRPPSIRGWHLSDVLVAAICAEQEAIVLTLIDAGVGVDRGQYEKLDTGTDLEYGTKGPALLEALRQKNANIVQLLLDAGVDINYHISYPDRSALIEAAEWGNHSILEELIVIGADINAIDREGCTALVISVEEKDIISTQLLLNAGADVNNGRSRSLGLTALGAAVTNGDTEMVEHLLSIGANPDDSQALSQALSQGMLMIEKLLAAFTRRYPHGKRGYGCGALVKAIQEEDRLLIELLLQAEIDANTLIEGLTPLGAAIEEEHASSLALLQKLLDASGNPSSIVRSALRPSYHKETALLAAINTKDIQKIQLLIDARADVNWPATKRVQRTPLQKAAEIGSFQIAKILIDHGGLVNAQPAVRGGATALQLAAIGGYIGIAELLLDNGADVNAPSAKVHGRTALEGAAEYGRIDMLKLLSNAGANFHGSEYERAMQLAKKNGHMATRRYLESLSTASEGSFLDM